MCVCVRLCLCLCLCVCVCVCATGPDGLTPYLQDGWRVFQGSGWYLGVAEQEGNFQARGEPRDSVCLLLLLLSHTHSLSLSLSLPLSLCRG